MRFFWLALALVSPLVFAFYIADLEENQTSELVMGTVSGVAVIFIVIAAALSIAGFIKHRNEEQHTQNRRLLEERDADISKWRRLFFVELGDVYDTQKSMLTKAHELSEQHKKYSTPPSSGKPFESNS